MNTNINMDTHTDMDMDMGTDMGTDADMSVNRKGLRTMLAICQDEMVMKDRIAALLRDGSKTIVEISQALNYPTNEVLVWLMAMRRYGQVEEVGRANVDGYFAYQLTEKETEAAE